jgi:hypothetical protein
MPEGTRRLYVKGDLLTRLMARVVVAESGCWEWQGALDQAGYGRMGLANQRTGNTHRVSYKLHVGPIPAGFVVDHLCRNRRCCNPDHLEAITRKENTLRGMGPTAVNAAKTECQNGHAFDRANTYIGKVGQRSCRACRRIEFTRAS